jgi:hypothetical protein
VPHPSVALTKSSRRSSPVGRHAEREAASSDADRVFLNVPFDHAYEPVFIGLVGSLIHLGRKPTTVLDLDFGGGPRFGRLLSALSASPASVHDLSRVTLSGHGARAVPRFNMPFELGLAIASSQLARSRHLVVVLEARPYRLQRSLSDMNGFDPFIHRGTQEGAVRSMLEAFSDSSPVDVLTARRLVRELNVAARVLKRRHRARTIFSRTLVAELVHAASRLRQSVALQDHNL